MGFGSERGGAAGYPHGVRRQGDEGRAASVFALIRAWAAAIIVLLVSQYLTRQLVFEPLADADRLDSFGWRLALLHLPTAVCAMLAALVAARLHREPFRDSPLQHLTAALAVPLVAQMLTLLSLSSLVDLQAEGILLSSLAVLTGCGIAVGVDLMREGQD